MHGDSYDASAVFFYTTHADAEIYYKSCNVHPAFTANAVRQFKVTNACEGIELRAQTTC